MTKQLINHRCLSLCLSVFSVKGWMKLLFLGGMWLVPCSISATGMTSSGEQTVLLYSCIFIVLMAGGVIAFLIYTIRVRSRAQRSIQEMESARQNFFTNIIHEFRTPLTVILGVTDGLKKRLADRHTEPGFDLIIRQGNEMLSLVNQLLYISNVRSVVGYKDWRTGDVVAFLRMIVEAMRVRAAKELIDIELSTSDDSIQMDFVPDYMKKMLQSLFSNSIKFTPRGGKIQVSVTLEKKMVHIVMTDTGAEIAAKDLPHVFDPFYQTDASNGDLRTGIGLSLVRQMTEAMDGKIEVSGMKEKGTEFRITLPQSHADVEFKQWVPEEEQAAEEPSVPDKKEETPRGEEEVSSDGDDATPADGETSLPALLVIEDSVDIAYYIGELLEDRYRLFFARNGKDGLAKAKEYMPDLILTDLMMPEMDGYELCRAVRASDILNHIPVIVVTARCEEKDRLMGIEAGADAYLVKPFNADELKMRVAKLLEQRKLLREKYSKALQEGLSDNVEISDADKEFMARLQKALFANISDTDLSSEVLANKLFMSKSQLNRKVKSITGLDTATYVRQSRMSFAKKLISEGDLSIGDVVERCGFESPSYFTKIFKQYFGVPPSQYRKRMEK